MSAHSVETETSRAVIDRPLQQGLDGRKERVDVFIRIVKVEGQTHRFPPAIMYDARVCQYTRCRGYITGSDESCGPALTPFPVREDCAGRQRLQKAREKTLIMRRDRFDSGFEQDDEPGSSRGVRGNRGAPASKAGGSVCITIVPDVHFERFFVAELSDLDVRCLRCRFALCP